MDESLTFKEFRELFEKHNITAENSSSSDFDPPKASKGAAFPVSRGLLQSIEKHDDLTEGDIIAASGKNNFKEIIKEFEDGELNCKYMELLCCKGCIMGPGMTNKDKRYFKRNRISDYIKQKTVELNKDQWEKDIKQFENIDISQSFKVLDRREESPNKEEIKETLLKMGKKEDSDMLNCGACGYDTCEEHAIAIIQGRAETEMCLPYTIEKLHNSIKDLNVSNENLASARQALKHSEKLANMGQLSAGIAHELNNPLGVITMYSNILKDETEKDKPIFKDLELIVEQTERCKKIVGGLLNFARKNKVNKQETNLKKFVEHSAESIVIPENINLNIKSEIEIPLALFDKEQMMQVLTNLEKNAIEAMPEGGILSIKIKENNEYFRIIISDTGVGIPKENMDKLFTPFFTTKKIGKGTGLGLPLVYGIVKMHKGKIKVESNADKNKGQTGTSFIIDLPKN